MVLEPSDPADRLAPLLDNLIAMQASINRQIDVWFAICQNQQFHELKINFTMINIAQQLSPTYPILVTSNTLHGGEAAGLIRQQSS
jgi:hypothetical protein